MRNFKKHNVIGHQLTLQMCNMVGFRNISVYDYSQVKPEIVNSIVQNHLVDFENYYSVIYEHAKKWSNI